jgi:RNA polymerase sigma-70 factor (ECF subfamily)
MERGSRWTGNTSRHLRVARGNELPTLIGNLNPEDVNITALMSPASMSHPERYRDASWVEPSDEPYGTAVFDATGDKTAMPSWDELVRQHADRVYRLAYRLSGNQHDAEDLTQETFIRVFRSVQNYQPGTFEGWLHRITTNLFLDMVRRRGRVRMEALPEDYDRVPADEPNPEEIYHDSRLGPDLQAALDSLPPEFRAAVVLCDIEGLSYEEIGATLGAKRCATISRRTPTAPRRWPPAAASTSQTDDTSLLIGSSFVFRAVQRATFEIVPVVSPMGQTLTSRGAGDDRAGSCVPPRVLLAPRPIRLPERRSSRGAPAVRLHRAPGDRGHRGFRRRRTADECPPSGSAPQIAV